MPEKVGDKFTLDGDNFKVEVIAVHSDRVLVKYPDGDEEMIRINFEGGEYLVSRRETITEKDGSISTVEMRYVGIRDGRQMVDIVAVDENGEEFSRGQLIQNARN